MLKLGTIANAELKVWADVQRVVSQIRQLCASDVTNVVGGVRLLRALRTAVYEDLNQIQHEHMILWSAHWLIAARGFNAETIWEWNPRQTDDASEPDLRGRQGDEIVVSAEVTTSQNPKGTIDSHMAKTLAKLNKMAGRKFYFVRTAQMQARARTKIGKHGSNIEVVLLDMPLDESGSSDPS